MHVYSYGDFNKLASSQFQIENKNIEPVFAGILDDDFFPEDPNETQSLVKKISERRNEIASATRTIVQLYIKSVETRPVLTMAFQTFTIVTLGDICAQVLVNALDRKPQTLLLHRLAAMGLWAFFFMGPCLQKWYELLHWTVKGRWATFMKVALDQLVFAPFFLALFIIGIGLLEGNSIQEVQQSLSTGIMPTMVVNWLIWPLAQTISFTFVPKNWRLLYVNLVGFFWNVLLTWLYHDGLGHKSVETGSKSFVVPFASFQGR